MTVMTARRVLGIDPGPTESGYGIVELMGRQGRVRFLEAGMMPSDGGRIRAMLEEKRGQYQGLSLAVEKPCGYIFQHARGAALLETRGIADEFSVAAEMLCIPVVCLTAQKWRGALCGKGVRGVASDAVVKQAVKVYVDGLPNRTSTHVRDALGIACVAAFNMGGAKRTRNDGLGGLVMMLSMTEIVEACARAAHEMHSVYCLALGDAPNVPWEKAPEWQRSGARNGVVGALAGNTPEQSHESWLEEKRATGWKYGPEKNPETKEHPCFVPYAELPEFQRVKNDLFTTTVRSMGAALGWSHSDIPGLATWGRRPVSK